MCKCTDMFLLNNNELTSKWTLTSIFEQMVSHVAFGQIFGRKSSESPDSILQSPQADQVYCTLTRTPGVLVPRQRR